MKRLLLISVLIFALIISLSACGGNGQGSGATNDEAAVSATSDEALKNIQIGASKGDTYAIEAGGLVLKYPAKWKDKVEVTLSDNRASFTRGDDKLFDILFNSDKGNVLGTVKGDNYTVVSVVDYKTDKADAELTEMVNDINVIINNLSKDYDFAVGERIVDTDSSVFDIKTSVTTLKFPSKWKDKVKVDVTDDGVKFSSGDTKVFDIMFVEGDGYLLGKYNDTPVYVIDYPVKEQEQMEMQAGINVILSNLREDSNFKEAE